MYSISKQNSKKRWSERIKIKPKTCYVLYSKLRPAFCCNNALILFLSENEGMINTQIKSKWKLSLKWILVRSKHSKFLIWFFSRSHRSHCHDTVQYLYECNIIAHANCYFGSSAINVTKEEAIKKRSMCTMCYGKMWA